MPDLALARTDFDFSVSGREEAPRRAARAGGIAHPGPGARKPEKSRLPRRSGWKYFGRRNLAIAACASIMLGFLVNALALQQEHHPAPLFMPAASVAASAAAASAAASIALPVPVPKPAELATASLPLAAPVAKPATSAHPGQPRNAAADPIAQLLRPHVATDQQDGAQPAPSKPVLAAQKALVKLGFALKPDGVLGGTTRQAIERFERDQGMPVKGELTPKIMRMLAAESGARTQ